MEWTSGTHKGSGSNEKVLNPGDVLVENVEREGVKQVGPGDVKSCG